MFGKHRMADERPHLSHEDREMLDLLHVLIDEDEPVPYVPVDMLTEGQRRTEAEYWKDEAERLSTHNMELQDRLMTAEAILIRMQRVLNGISS